MYDAFRYIDRKKSDIIKFTEKLINIPTQNPPGENYEKLVSVLEVKCRKLKLNTKRIIVPYSELKKANVEGSEKRIILLAGWNIGGRKLLHMNAHYDVVPATTGWKTDPFKAKFLNGKLYGRGSEDDKGNIACMLFAVESLVKSGITPKVNIELSFTPDEETGGETGFGYLAKKKMIKPDYAIGEGHGREYVSFGNKGILWAEIEVFGKSAHASEPYRGINAFEKAIAISSELLKLKRKIDKRRTKYKTIGSRERYATMVIGGMVKGGSKVNTVPDRVSFTIDRRILPDEDFETSKNELENTLNSMKKKDASLKFKLNINTHELPVVSDLNSPLAKSMEKAIMRVYSKKARFAITSGGTDMRFLARRKIDCMGYSAAGGDRCHADDEFIYVKSLVNTAKVFAHILSNLT